MERMRRCFHFSINHQQGILPGADIVALKQCVEGAHQFEKKEVKITFKLVSSNFQFWVLIYNI